MPQHNNTIQTKNKAHPSNIYLDFMAGHRKNRWAGSMVIWSCELVTFGQRAVTSGYPNICSLGNSRSLSRLCWEGLSTSYHSGRFGTDGCPLTFYISRKMLRSVTEVWALPKQVVEPWCPVWQLADFPKLALGFQSDFLKSFCASVNNWRE